jgi:hypothetical protein
MGTDAKPLNLSWREKSGLYLGNGEWLYVGEICAGGWFYDAMYRDTNLHYAIEVYLPTWKPKQRVFATQEEAKAALDAFARRWFQKAGVPC